MRKMLLLLFGVALFAFQAIAQQKVSGRVTDESGKPVPNASVMVKGTTTGTVTKADGTYSLTVPSNAKALIFSSVDMTTMELTIGNNKTIDAIFSIQDKALTEVVVTTAFGIKKDKRTLGYGVTEMKAEQLTQAHTTSISNALAGKIPGVRVSGSGGSFTGSSILIRGYTTFTGSNQPLFVVDGIPIDNSGGGSPLQNGPTVSNRTIDLNQEDIESISVLKGPSAAVLYGSRASNGVIVITMKKGKASPKNAIQYSTSYATEEVNRYPDLQNLYAQGNGGVFPTAAAGATNASWGPLITGQIVNQYDPTTNLVNKSAPLMAYPNNVRGLFQNGVNWQNNISFSGGTDKNTFRFSYGYLRNTGVLYPDKLTRHNFSLSTSSKVNNYLTVSANGNYSNNTSTRSQQGNQLSNPLFRGWFTPRSYDLLGMPFEDAIGNQRYPMGEDHPLWTLKNNRFNDEINRFIGNVSFNFKLFKWLQADYKIGTDVYSIFRHAYDQIGARGGANTTANQIGGIRESRNNYRSLNSNGYLTFNKRFGNFNGLAIIGTEFQQIYSNAAQLDGKGIIVRNFEQLNNTTTYTPSPSNGSSKGRLLGAYGDFTLSYKSVASINFTLRNDWASTFKPGNNSYLYNGLGGSVNITELFPGMKGKIFENLKIRGNVATVGKAGDFLYATDSYFGGAGASDGFGPVITFPYNGIQGFGLSNSAGNALLKPEFTQNKEIAIEASFLKGRFGFEFTRYWQNSRDLIFSVPISAASGITSVTKNSGDLENKGIEISLTGSPVKSKSVSWDITVTYTDFKSIVKKLAVGVPVITLAGFVTPNVRLVAGDEYGQIYGSAYLRDPLKGNALILTAGGLPQAASQVKKIGNPNPDYLMGITNSINFKGFYFTFLFDYRKGGDIYSRNVADLQRRGAAKETAEFPRFNANGTPTTPYMFQGVYANGSPNTTMVSAEQYWGDNGKYVAAEGFIYDATWFRLREAAIGYKLPGSFLKKTPFGNAEFSVYGRNLFLHAPNYPHLDPEQNALGVSNAQGLEFNALPATRSIGVSLKLSF